MLSYTDEGAPKPNSYYTPRGRYSRNKVDENLMKTLVMIKSQAHIHDSPSGMSRISNSRPAGAPGFAGLIQGFYLFIAHDRNV